MTLEDAIKRPFQNSQKLAIGTIISAIPLVNLIAVGYFLECFRRSMKKDNSLPEWGDWGKIILDGLKASVVQIVYAVPLMALLLIIFGGVILGVLASAAPDIAAGNLAAAMTKVMGALTANIGTLLLGILIFFIAAVIIGLLSTAAVVRFAETENFNSAFALSEVKSIGLTSRFLISVILGSIVATALAFVIAIPVAILTLIPFVGLIVNFLGQGLLSFVAGIIFWTIVGERYAEDFKHAVSTPIKLSPKARKKK